MSGTDLNRAFAIQVARRLQHAGFQALWAGGCVRDTLLDRQPKDYDIATNARPDEVRRLFGHRRTLAVGASFGVIIVRNPRRAGDVEVATFRSEGSYGDGRHPDSVAFTTAEEDAERRDFTINGMFYDPIARRVLDFVGGEKDLGLGIVRAIGDPKARMREDKLRMLRAVRFAAHLEFELDRETADAIRAMAEEIHVVSAERIAQELRRMLVDPHRMRAVELTCDVGLLPHILPELQPVLDASADAEADDAWTRTLHMLGHLEQPGFELAAATLVHAAAAPSSAAAGHEPEELARSLGTRLRLSNKETDHIGWLLAHQHDLKDADQLPQAQLKRLMAHPLVEDLLSLVRVATLVGNADMSPVLFCEEFLRNTPAEEIDPPPLVTGEDLIDTGLKPGPHFKMLLEAIRDAQLNLEIHTKPEALALARRLLSKESEEGPPES